MSDPPAPGGLSPSAAKVQDALSRQGFATRVIELDVPVRTAADAAREVGCELAQIVKSLVFRTTRSGRGVLVLTSGKNRVNETRLGELVGEPVAKADPDFVREQTGFAIGGVPPTGHTHPLETLLDEDLLGLSELWAAAGHPRSLFRLTPDELVRMSRGRVLRVT